MSFSDMMQSGRGPGVIGMLLALLVLFGFGLLFMLAFNESPANETQSIQAVIKDQAKEVEDLTETIARRQKELTVIPKLEAAQGELRTIKRQLVDAQQHAEALQADVAKGQQAITAKAADLEKYKDQYRNAARQGAKDEAMAKLQTRSGQVYEKVVISDVNPIGMQIRHQGGLARIPYEDLPADLQDRFQFDPNQKAATVAQENAERKEHETAVATSLKETQQQLEARKKAEAEAQQADAKRAIAVKTTQISTLDSDIIRLQGELQRELQKKFKNTYTFTSQIAEKLRLRNQLQAEIAELRASSN
jgi:chromosome segregation ATPase